MYLAMQFRKKMVFRKLLLHILLCLPFLGNAQYRNPKDTTVVLLFKSGAFTPDTVAMKQLEQVYNKLIKNDSVFFYQILISGFTDDKGKDTSNYVLSKKRAHATGDALLSFAKESIILKKGVIDYMSQCDGVQYEQLIYKVPINFEYFGERGLKSKLIDGLAVDKERKVLVRFVDNRGFCLGVFSMCYLPSQDEVLTRDSTITLSLPRGYLDAYTVRSGYKRCRYEPSDKLTVRIADSLPSKDALCSQLISSYGAGEKQNELKIGSLGFTFYLNDTLLPPRKCKTNFYEENKVRIRLDPRLIVAKDFVLYNDNKELIEYTRTDSFIELFANLNESKTIEVYLKNNAFTRSTLLIKGKKEFRISEREPVNKCKVPLEATGFKQRLFSSRRTYNLIKFAKSSNKLYLYDPQKDKELVVDFKQLKYRKKRRMYILGRRTIKKAAKQQ